MESNQIYNVKVFYYVLICLKCFNTSHRYIIKMLPIYRTYRKQTIYSPLECFYDSNHGQHNLALNIYAITHFA